MPNPADARSPINPAVGGLLRPFYAGVVAHRNRRWDAGHGVRRTTIPVISVGNISVGGAGKTPMVRWIVERLREAGRRPGIVLRGYGPKHNGRSDEEAEHRSAMPGVPVRANPDRLRAIGDLIRRTQGVRVDCVVLDDGFQHRRLARDADIVLIDATRDPWKDRLLPAGWLREPPQSLQRATGVVITHAESVSPSHIKQLRDSIESSHGKPPLAITSHVWTGLRIHEEGAELTRAVDWLKGRRVFGLCAIARPRPFMATLRLAEANITGSLSLRDHAQFTEKILAKVIEQAAGVDTIVCTEKDWMKIGETVARRFGVPVVRPVLEHHFLEGAHELADHVTDAVNARR